MVRVIRVNPLDNVAIAVQPLAAGEELALETMTLRVNEEIRPGHKIALCDLAPGEDLIRYGYSIGKATSSITKGSWVHTHNLTTNLGGLLEYHYSPRLYSSSSQDENVLPKFMGYRRPDGRVGIRNELWIVPTVGCVNHVARNLAKAASEAIKGTNLDGIFTFSHPYGCNQLGDDLRNTQKVLAGLIRHPNAGGVLLIGLGCESNATRAQLQVAAGYDPEKVRFFSAQDVPDEMESGMVVLKELAEYAGSFRREPCPISDLTIGLKCGGSDGFSGITANPLVGSITDRITEWGGTALMTEVPEMFGAETILMNRAIDDGVFKQTVELINGFKNYFIEHHQPIYENPAPGNREGGITTLEEKSLGCILKGGRANVTEVLRYAERVSRKGLVLLSAPGNDGVSTTALVASGAVLLLFTTGRGTPLGTPAPVIKISSTTELAKRKASWIDFDAGKLLNDDGDESSSFQTLSFELMQLLIAVASGEHRTRNEVSDMRDIAIFKTGVTV